MRTTRRKRRLSPQHPEMMMTTDHNRITNLQRYNVHIHEYLTNYYGTEWERRIYNIMNIELYL